MKSRVDVQKLEKILDRERQAKLICAELNNFVDLKSVLSAIIANIKNITGCEATGIRLHDDGDYPFFVSGGFSESFIEKENSLCIPEQPGVSAQADEALLACLCGRVIQGSADSSFPFFTAKGSFWTNSLSDLERTHKMGELFESYRRACLESGYESLALIPISNKGKHIGLIQINDRRKGLLSGDVVEFLEMIGEQIGLAVHNSLIYTKLEKTVAEVKELNKKLEEAASTDPLTGLANRRAFMTMAEYEKIRYSRNRKPFALIMCDIDYFKRINDTIGHAAGDFILKNLASMLRRIIRQQDIVCRWGGEEFIILLPDTGITGGKQLAEKLRRAVENEQFSYNSHDIRLTMSFGITACQDNLTIYSYINKADEAMYIAKRNGRNRVVAEPAVL